MSSSITASLTDICFNLVVDSAMMTGVPAVQLPSPSDFVLDIIDSIWGQRGYPWEPAFLDRMARSYGAGVFLERNPIYCPCIPITKWYIETGEALRRLFFEILQWDGRSGHWPKVSRYFVPSRCGNSVEP